MRPPQSILQREWSETARAIIVCRAKEITSYDGHVESSIRDGVMALLWLARGLHDKTPNVRTGVSSSLDAITKAQ